MENVLIIRYGCVCGEYDDCGDRRLSGDELVFA